MTLPVSAVSPPFPITPEVLDKYPYAIRRIAVRDLKIDPRYQREPNMRRVAVMAQRWSLLQAGALTVSHREDGALYIVDGQHRLLAMRERGETEAMCFVVNGLTFQQECLLFDALNINIVKLNVRERFKARLLGDDPIAGAIRDIVEAAGFKINLSKNIKPGQINAVQALEELYQPRGTVHHYRGRPRPERLERVLRLIALTWEHDHEALDGQMLKAVNLLLHVYGEDIADDRFVAKIGAVSAGTIKRRAAALHEVRGGALYPHLAQALWSQYNHGAKTNRLPDRWSEQAYQPYANEHQEHSARHRGEGPLLLDLDPDLDPDATD